MHPVCICLWHRCNGVTMAAGFALLPLDCGRGRSSGDAGLTGVWFLLEGHFATCESGRRGSHEETAQSIHFLGLPSSGLCWGVTMEVRDGPMPSGGVVRSKHGDDLSRAMIAREDSQGVLDDVDT